MNRQRRRVLKGAIMASATCAAAGLPQISAASRGAAGAAKPFRLLVLGGTGFIGPHTVREALGRGFDVELFNRGRTNDDLFPELKTYIGDRNGKLDALEGGQWDAVIDNSGYVPRHVADSARLLADAASQYVFVSSISAYASFDIANDEFSPLARLADDTVEEVTNETYGGMKALSEKRAAEEFGADRVTIIRPTYICGPGDPTDRYTYWPVRSARGGEMLWPGTPSDPIQIIDPRDLAAFLIDCVEQRITGPYNTTTRAGAFTMGELLADCRAVTEAELAPTWVDADFLREQGLLETGEIPIWSPTEGAYGKAALVSGERAHAAGLRTRPTVETARDTLRWWQGLPAERTARLRAGPSAEREAALLAEWRQAEG